MAIVVGCSNKSIKQKSPTTKESIYKMKLVKLAGLFATVAASGVFAQEAAPAVEAQPMEEASSVSASATLDVASAYIYESGAVIDDSLVIQPGFSVGFDALGGIPLSLGTWANYSTDKYGTATQNHCFTEVDLSIGTSYEFDNGPAFGLSLISWQYPNVEGVNGEELVSATVSQSLGMLTLGTKVEMMLTGDYDNDWHLVPYAELGSDIAEGVSAALRGQMFYYYAESEGEDAWMAYNIKATIGLYDFSVYASYYGQIDDSVYTDEMNDIEDMVFGIGYAVDL